ncbi:MAG: response regulator transcription factor [Verrucomicrobia bacterium]|nr:response regulator transcription factor [Verrucomicrobiota bacterium]
MPTFNPPLTLLLVDDHFVFRAGLKAVLSLRKDFAVVAEAGDAASAVEAFRKHEPGMTLMDLRLPDRSGIEALQAIRKENPAARVLMLTTFDRDEDIHRALEAGACGYLLKSVPGPELLRAIEAAALGKRYIPPEVQRRLEERATFGELTDREREVLPLVAKGLTNKEIAGILGFTEFTAKAHMRSLLAKLGAADRTELVAIAVQRGLVHWE